MQCIYSIALERKELKNKKNHFNTCFVYNSNISVADKITLFWKKSSVVQVHTVQNCKVEVRSADQYIYQTLDFFNLLIYKQESSFTWVQVISLKPIFTDTQWKYTVVCGGGGRVTGKKAISDHYLQKRTDISGPPLNHKSQYTQIIQLFIYSWHPYLTCLWNIFRTSWKKMYAYQVHVHVEVILAANIIWQYLYNKKKIIYQLLCWFLTCF